jgi:hypothetical protein
MERTSCDIKKMPETDDLSTRKVETRVDPRGQRERAKLDRLTGKKPQGRNPGRERDGDR